MYFGYSPNIFARKESERSRWRSGRRRAERTEAVGVLEGDRHALRTLSLPAVRRGSGGGRISARVRAPETRRAGVGSGSADPPVASARHPRRDTTGPALAQAHPTTSRDVGADDGRAGGRTGSGRRA